MATLYETRPCCDPAALAAQGLPTERFRGKANSFRLTAGRGPGRGWVLLTKSDLDALDLTAAHDLTLSGESTSTTVTFQSITLLNRECVTPGASADGAAVYVCEVVDRRHFLGMVPLAGGEQKYNVSNDAGTAYLSATTDSGVPWTWQGVVDDLATLLGEDAAEFELPFTPDGKPENLVFSGCSAWEALNRVLDRLACVAAYDPTTDTFEVIRLGEGMGDAIAALEGDTNFAGVVADTYASEEVRGWRPEKVRVLFPRRPQPTDGAAPYYADDITLAATTGVEPGTFAVLWDDATAEGASGAPTNAAALATRAQERADDWLRERRDFRRPFARAWRDFQPLAVQLAGRYCDTVVYDDTGDLMRTWATEVGPSRTGDWKPLGGYPVWWPFEAGGGSSPLTTKGDVYTYSTADARLPVGTNGQVLTADSTQATGLKWATPGSSGSAWKEPVRAATVSAGTLSSSFENGDTVDGVTLATGDRILIKNQSSASENGIYTVNASGAPTRAADADTAAEILGATVAVTNGTVNADSVWLCTANATITVGSTSLPWRSVSPESSQVDFGAFSLTAPTPAAGVSVAAATGAALTLPSAGTYEVLFQTDVFLETPAFGCQLLAYLYNSTAAATVVPSSTVVVGLSGAGGISGGLSLSSIVTVTVPSTIQLWLEVGADAVSVTAGTYGAWGRYIRLK